MLEDGKRISIHQPMRDTIDSIKTLYDLYAGELQEQTAKGTNRSSSATQTSPWIGNQEAKRKHGETLEIPEAKGRTPNPAPRTPAKETTQVTLCRQEDTEWRTEVAEGHEKKEEEQEGTREESEA